MTSQLSAIENILIGDVLKFNTCRYCRHNAVLQFSRHVQFMSVHRIPRPRSDLPGVYLHVWNERLQRFFIRTTGYRLHIPHSSDFSRTSQDWYLLLMMTMMMIVLGYTHILAKRILGSVLYLQNSFKL